MDLSVPTARFLQGSSTQSPKQKATTPASEIRSNLVQPRLTYSMQSARITYLSNTLIKRIGNIFEEALTNGPTTTEPTSQNDSTSHTVTAMQQFQLEVESTALVRAAEEVMVLTRSMKDVWLFGGLDTLASDHKDERIDGAQPEDIKAVAEFIQKHLGSDEAEDIMQPAEAQEKGS